MDALDIVVTLGARSAFRIGAALSTLAWWKDEKARMREAGLTVRLAVQDVGASPKFWAAAQLLGVDSVWDRLTHHAREGSQRLRHVWAERWCETEYRVLADDDIVLTPGYTVVDIGKPGGGAWWEYVARVMSERPTLAMCSPIPSPGGLDPSVGRAFLDHVGATDEQGVALADAMKIPTSDEHLWPVSGVGGFRFVRKGVIPEDFGALPVLNPMFAGGYDSTLGSWIASKGYDCGYLTRMQAVHLGYARSTAAAVEGFMDEGVTDE